MAARAEVDLDDMEAYPFASFESGVSVSVEFSEEVLFSSLNAFTKRIYVVDRGTMINTLTHTDAFSIGTGILSEGFAGPELVSRPIRGHQREIHLGWIQPAGGPIPEPLSAFLREVEAVVAQ